MNDKNDGKDIDDRELIENPGGNGPRKTRRKFAAAVVIFAKTLLISLTVCSVLAAAGFVIFKSVVKPPVIPTDGPIGAANPASDAPDAGGPAFLPPDGAEEDMLIGDGLRAPEGFTSDDRKEEFYTFLIVGMDKGANTDTIMIASYDGVNKETNIIGVPRDSLVNVRRNVKKINSAYMAGTLYGGGMEGGVAQLRREIKTIIGFVPDFYVLIDLNAFVEIIDAIDGIDVYAPMRMLWDDPLQNLHIDIPAGDNHLDGAEALKFARYRMGNDPRYTISDYQRIENQQTVIKAVLGKLLRPESILKIPGFIDIFNKNVHSDIKPENMLWFADQLNKIRGTDALSTYALPTCGSSGLPMYYEYLDETAIVELVNRTVNPYTKDIEAKDLDIIGGE